MAKNTAAPEAMDPNSFLLSRMPRHLPVSEGSIRTPPCSDRGCSAEVREQEDRDHAGGDEEREQPHDDRHDLLRISGIADADAHHRRAQEPEGAFGRKAGLERPDHRSDGHEMDEHEVRHPTAEIDYPVGPETLPEQPGSDDAQHGPAGLDLRRAVAERPHRPQKDRGAADQREQSDDEIGAEEVSGFVPACCFRLTSGCEAGHRPHDHSEPTGWSGDFGGPRRARPRRCALGSARCHTSRNHSSQASARDALC